MGNRPKAMLVIDGETFLARAVGRCRQAGCDPVWMVIRPGAPDLAALAASLPGFPTVNSDPERGMFSSVQCGLAAAFATDAEPEGFLIHPVDHPAVRVDTLALVIGQLRAAGPEAWVVPRFAGRGGHPVGVGRDTARALLAAPAESSLRRALRSSGYPRGDLDVYDPGILANLNQPQDAPDGKTD